MARARVSATGVRPATARTGCPVVPADAAARMVLAHAVLAEPRQKSNAAAVAAMVRRLGYVQVDSIVAVERAHDTILRTRLAGYRPEHLRMALERDRALFEHWTHDASLVPVEWLPYWHARFRRHRVRMKTSTWWKAQSAGGGPRLLTRVLRMVEQRGPLRARDLPGERAPSGGWWNWNPQKAALESLWRMGRVAIAHRHGFEKAYDLFERVHAERMLPAATPAEHARWACREALARLGVATPLEIARFFSDCSAPAVERWAQSRDGRAVAVPVLRARVGGGTPERAYAWRPSLDAPVAELAGVRVLSPFDPVVRDRTRLERLWGFVYRFEAFVPQAKRTDGYYTLPVLDGAAFIGRCALRADRARGRLVLERWRGEGGRAGLPRSVRAALEAFALETGLDGLETSPRATRRTP